MEIILFIYGLSFFVLGVLVLFVKTKESDFFFAKKIWLLDAFAILHACVEWVFLYMYLYPETERFLIPVKLILLLSSYLFLFEFSRFIVRESFRKKTSKLHFLHILYAAPVIYIISLSSLLILILIHPSVDDTIAAIRYTYGFFGSFFLGLGLYFYGDSLKKIEYIDRLKLYFKIPGIAFIIYALLAGIAVTPTLYFPGNLINTEWFLDVFNIPVQFFRAICALVITICSIRALQIFSDEADLKLRKSLKQIKRFSSDVSHELKTPLTAMKGEMEVALLEPRSDEEYRRVLTSSLEEVDKLQSIVKNLLMLTYLEKKPLKSTFLQHSLDDIVLNTIEDLMLIANRHKITLEILHLDTIEMRCDNVLIKTIFINVIENAIKYSPENTTVYIALRNAHHKAIFSVEDEGFGIDEEKIVFVFDRFYRSDDSRSKNIKGFGLGLSIVHQIVQAHDGTISIHNRPEKGLHVSIQLPL
ncbi:MAG: HAMP domain-containing sensor histidine kinase [Sulfurospirillaceae bacterium]|nr:HAMP domain-containing sensor histidine kinase [Sulfurospirillaceae bacterium]